MLKIEHVSDECQCAGKLCTRCKEHKCLMKFDKGLNKSGRQSHCKVCRSEYAKMKRSQLTEEELKEVREKERLSSRRYHQANRDKCLKAMRRRYQENIEYHRVYARERTREYVKINKERIKEYHKKYYAINAEWIKEKVANNPYRYTERARLKRREWIQRNYEHYLRYRRPHYSLRRTRKTLAGGSYTAQEWEALKAKYNYTCLRCGRSEPEIQLTADHVIPVSKNGTSNIDNIQPLCKSCNSRKHAKSIDYRR